MVVLPSVTQSDCKMHNFVRVDCPSSQQRACFTSVSLCGFIPTQTSGRRPPRSPIAVQCESLGLQETKIPHMMQHKEDFRLALIGLWLGFVLTPQDMCPDTPKKNCECREMSGYLRRIPTKKPNEGRTCTRGRRRVVER